MSEAKVPAVVLATDTKCFLTLLYFTAGCSNSEVKRNNKLFTLQIQNESYEVLYKE